MTVVLEKPDRAKNLDRYDEEIRRITKVARKTKRWVMSRSDFDIAIEIVINSPEKSRNWQRARDLIVEGNMGIVKTNARLQKDHGVAMDDLISAGVEGLIKAIGLFEPSLQLTFANYAYWWVRAAMQDEVKRNGKMIRLPAGIHKKYKTIARCVRDYRSNLKRIPTISEIAKTTGLTEEEITETLNAINLQPETGEKEESWGEDIPWHNPEQSGLDDFCRGKIHEIVEAMPSEYKGILKMTYGLNQNGRSFKPAEIQAITGLSTEVLAERQERSIHYLREMFDRNGLKEAL